KGLNAKVLFLGAAIGAIAYFGIFPLVILIVRSLLSNGNISFRAYQEVFSNPANLEAFKNTLVLGCGVVFLTTFIGVPLGWLLTRTDLPRAKRWQTLFSLPYIIPPYIGAIAWIELANPKMGYLNRMFETPIFNIYSMPGIIFVEGLFLYTFMLLATITAMEQIDISYEEAAKMSGASGCRVMWDITLPLIRPHLIAGAVLTFVATAASFGVPAMIGMPKRIHVLTTKIYTLTQGYGDGISSATALSVALMAIALVFLFLSGQLQKGGRVAMVGGKSARRSLVSLGKWRKPIQLFLWVLAGFMILLPLSTIFLTSLQKVYGRGFGFENLTLHKYGYVLFEMKKTGRAILNSLQLATITASIAIVIGTLVAYFRVKTKVKGRGVIDLLATLPYATPGIVVALGLIIAFSGGFGLNLYNTMAILFVAYFVKYLSFSTRTSGAALEQIDPSLEEAGRMSGAGWTTILRTIIFPLLKPALIAGWFLIFMPVLSELTMSILLFGPDTEVIGTVLYNLQAYDDPQAAAVLGVLIVAIVLGANACVKMWTKGRYGI
ncbi:MAG TPA: iron ABC transporter permease, partial [Bdellovibrionota bacterium]|nr:iron ABC transporter permease [Bdellovibrionota bacterium]